MPYSDLPVIIQRQYLLTVLINFLRGFLGWRRRGRLDHPARLCRV